MGLVGLAGLLWSYSGQADRATPAAIGDLDGDGIVDADDHCIDRPGLPPDGCPPRDSDGDGILDRADRCADAPGPVGNGGCPDPDGDGDGVVDRHDRCRTLHGHPDFAGCPPPDRDEDGVIDTEDRCVTRAETWNGKRDGDGCPDRGDALITVSRGAIAFAARRLFRRSGKLTSRGRGAVAVAAKALAAARARSIQVTVSGDGDKAGKQAAAVAEALGRLLAGLPITIEEVAPAAGQPPDKPTMRLLFR